MTPPTRLVPDRPSDAAIAQAFFSYSNGWRATDSLEHRLEIIQKAREIDEYGVPPTLTEQLQMKCSVWGTYWRAPDAHGVILNREQALELLRDALGVEVEIDAAAPPAEAPGERGDSPADYLFWTDGVPHRILSMEDAEWFIAEMVNGDRLVLRALPEEWTHDFTTADGTYIKAASIKRWMQFPDSEYKPLGGAQGHEPPPADIGPYPTGPVEEAIQTAVAEWEECKSPLAAQHAMFRIANAVRIAPRVTGGREVFERFAVAFGANVERFKSREDEYKYQQAGDLWRAWQEAHRLQAATGGEG